MLSGYVADGVPGGFQGVSGRVSEGFPEVSRGFRDNPTHCFPNNERVSARQLVALPRSHDFLARGGDVR